jgi:sodium bicarbonate transporter 10
MESDNKRGPNSDEVAKDPGALTTHTSYTDEDFEGHRAHSVYCTYGFQMPTSYRRRGHHRKHKHHKNGNKKREDGTVAEDNPQNMRPAERVQFILGEDDMDGAHESHPLFSELEELCINGEDLEWRETARWIKFEEDVEEGGDRWSKPHVATISLHSLFELRSCILNGTVMLDLEGQSLEQITDLVLENMVNSGILSLDIKNRVKEALLRRHRHQHEKRHDRNDSKNRLPLIRSLADIGRNSSKSMFSSHTGNNNNDGLPKSPSNTSLHLPTNNQQQSASTGQLHISTDSSVALQSSTSDLQHKVCKLVD